MLKTSISDKITSSQTFTPFTGDSFINGCLLQSCHMSIIHCVSSLTSRNLEQCEHIVGVSTVRFWAWSMQQQQFWRQPMFFGPVNNAGFHRFPVGSISQNSNTTTSIGVTLKTFRKVFLNFVMGCRCLSWMSSSLYMIIIGELEDILGNLLNFGVHGLLYFFKQSN